MEHTVPLILTTRRLDITRFDSGDLDDRLAYQSREDVARYLYREPLSREACAAGIERAVATTTLEAEGDTLIFAIRVRGERRVVGEVVLTLSDRRASQLEIGWVFNPEDAGRGYATEAARAIAELAFSEYGAHRLFARLDTENERSVLLCRRLGFRREAHLVENDRRLSGAWGSEFVYAALEEDLIRDDAPWR
ncbi:GNAT family N-acetyltransferase [Rathayibacter tanaceti]|uniref:GNAT family N-acetyltransferase n=2 Tax=Rathayibacter tanaceti TaxID=1671680 RepID=A0A162GKJ3_9MICO|nr:GNAT family N-acetyltransferase [Rathayibacter tanaceti]KZX22729.1 Spermidine N(1)-acetyltransferase [Rathayibacter tanaceti]QHC55917.1 GNAT family N-acetyltransferase [Rathayibacter tanaceti]TCO39250.1 RimJ/RimL family protein N-acetyltransferase [Rathayibacter tanaceti]